MEGTMLYIIMHDVGDGNHIDFTSTGLHSILKIDFGTNSKKDLLFKDFPPLSPFRRHAISNSFLLSHFHADHYNGLIQVLHRREFADIRFGFQNVYYPRFPKFPNSSILEKQMLFFNRLLLGDYSGSQQYDLIRIISKQNGRAFKYYPLSQGNRVQGGDMEAEILWPPRLITDNEFIKTVRDLIAKIEEVLSRHPRYDELYRKMNETPKEASEAGVNTDDLEEIELSEAEIPEEIANLGKDLRGIANRLSISFLTDKALLFLGDLECKEIATVIKYLKRSKFNHSEYMIAAHHGSHWHDSLLDIFANEILVSNGRRMVVKFKEGYKGITNRLRFTYLEGSIIVRWPRLTFECS